MLDIGTYAVKAGYAGEDTPKYVFPSVRRLCALPPTACMLGRCFQLPLLIVDWSPCSRRSVAHSTLHRAMLPACASCHAAAGELAPITCIMLLPPFLPLQSVGAIGGGPDGMEVDGAKRTLYVGTHALAHRRDGMEVTRGCYWGNEVALQVAWLRPHPCPCVFVLPDWLRAPCVTVLAAGLLQALCWECSPAAGWAPVMCQQLLLLPFSSPRWIVWA